MTRVRSGTYTTQIPPRVTEDTNEVGLWKRLVVNGGGLTYVQQLWIEGTLGLNSGRTTRPRTVGPPTYTETGLDPTVETTVVEQVSRPPVLRYNSD